jgi:aspartate aminotransferase
MKLSPEIQDSLELRFAALARKMNEKGEPIISLGLGEPSFPTPTLIIDAAAEAMKQGYTRYSNPFGLFELREAICKKLEIDNGIKADPSEIMVTSGAKMALSLVLASILQPGDEIINIVPCYPSYIPQIRIAEPEAVIRNIDLLKADFSLDLDAIRANFSPRTKALIINFPHNPTGKMLSKRELNGLVSLLEDHDCWLISDEIYERLNFSGCKHLSPGSIASIADRTITINGFSKAFSMTGWRIGYLVAKGPIMNTISKLQQHINTNVPPFIQKAALTALSIPADFINVYNNQLEVNSCALYTAISSGSILRLRKSEGGLFAFVDISGTSLNSDEFCTQLLRNQSVAATPGVVFGSAWDKYIRISLSASQDNFSEGVDRLLSFSAGF